MNNSVNLWLAIRFAFLVGWRSILISVPLGALIGGVMGFTVAILNIQSEFTLMAYSLAGYLTGIVVYLFILRYVFRRGQFGNLKISIEVLQDSKEG